MVLSLKKIFISEGESENFSAVLNMSNVKTLLDDPIKNPVSIDGSLRNSAGVVTLSYNLSTVLKANCARCFEEVSFPFKRNFEHIIVKDLSLEDDEAELILSENDELDMDALVASDLILTLPSRFLCSEDCKGLCSVCGCNKNKKNCSCKIEEIDLSKKLSKLSELLKS